MNFATFTAYNTPLFKNCNMLKYNYIINTESCIFENKCFNNNSLSIFTEKFHPLIKY